MEAPPFMQSLSPLKRRRRIKLWLHLTTYDDLSLTTSSDLYSRTTYNMTTLLRILC